MGIGGFEFCGFKRGHDGTHESALDLPLRAGLGGGFDTDGEVVGGHGGDTVERGGADDLSLELVSGCGDGGVQAGLGRGGNVGR